MFLLDKVGSDMLSSLGSGNLASKIALHSGGSIYNAAVSDSPARVGENGVLGQHGYRNVRLIDSDIVGGET